MNHELEIRFILKLGVGEFQLLFDEFEDRFLLNQFSYIEDRYTTKVFEVWDFNYDEYLFKFLQEGWQLEYMSVDEHFRVWQSLNEKDYTHKVGITLYKRFCKEKGITQEMLYKYSHVKLHDILQED